MTIEKGTVGSENQGENNSQNTPRSSLDTSKFSTEKKEEKPFQPASMEEMFNKKMAELTAEIQTLKSAQGKPLELPKDSGISKNDLTMLAGLMAEAIKQSNPEKIDYSHGIDESKIPLGDWNEKGVRFCCPQVGYILTDDIRKGQIIKLPFNKKEIFFNYVATRRVRTGKYEQIHPYSAYTSHSETEIQWLRDHTYYGSRFFESSTEALSVDVRKAQRLGEIMRMMQGYEMFELLKRCKENNVDPSEDVKTMRARLAHKIVMNEIDAEAEITKQGLEAAFKNEKLLGRVEETTG